MPEPILFVSPLGTFRIRIRENFSTDCCGGVYLILAAINETLVQFDKKAASTTALLNIVPSNG
jgi:hypothetical protein